MQLLSNGGDLTLDAGWEAVCSTLCEAAIASVLEDIVRSNQARCFWTPLSVERVFKFRRELIGRVPKLQHSDGNLGNEQCFV